MTAHETNLDEPALPDDGKVVPFRPRSRLKAAARRAQAEQIADDMDRFAVDIRGHVTVGRLMSGLATVGLTVRMDARSGRVIIADELGN
jgi:hypothetical protein